MNDVILRMGCHESVMIKGAIIKYWKFDLPVIFERKRKNMRVMLCLKI